MMNYTKGANVEEDLTEENLPFDNLKQPFLWMHVKGGTNVTNICNFAMDAIDKQTHHTIIFSGSGGAVPKTISCVEIIKRKYPINQLTKLCYRKVEEYWEPQIDNLEKLVVTRQIPCVHIKLSTNDVDEVGQQELGFQHSRKETTFWKETTSNKPTTQQPYNRPQQKQKDGRNNTNRPKSASEKSTGGKMKDQNTPGPSSKDQPKSM